MFTRTYIHSLSFYIFLFCSLFLREGEAQERTDKDGVVWPVIDRLKEKRKRGRERKREKKCPECGWLVGFLFLLIISRARQAGLGLYLADGKTIQSE